MLPVRAGGELLLPIGPVVMLDHSQRSRSILWSNKSPSPLSHEWDALA